MAHAVEFTLRHLPATTLVKDAAGLPFSCVLQPFARLDAAQVQPGEPMPTFSEVLRCSSCYSYINSHCGMDATSWQCAICRKVNDIKTLWQKRYTGNRAMLPELRREVYEMVMDESLPAAPGPQGEPTGAAPIYLALVDVSGDEEFVELVRSALLAALEGLPPYALFGLITFSYRVGLHDVRASRPSVRYVPLHESSEQPLPVPLAEAMPLRALLAPVGTHKDAIAAALEGLAPDPGVDRGQGGSAGAQQHQPPQPQLQGHPPGIANGGGHAAPQVSEGMQRGTTRAGRGFGPALLGVLEYLQAVTRPPFRPTELSSSFSSLSETVAQQQQQGGGSLPPLQSPVRLMAFLSGPPDLGPGRLLNPRARAAALRAQAAQAAAAAAAGQGQGTPRQEGVAGAAQSLAEGLSLHQDDSWLDDVSPGSISFYQQASVAAASLGTCVDLYAVSPSAVGLPFLQPLSQATGGAMYLYAGPEESALPQDVYRRVASPHANAGLLRVRTTKDFKPVRYYGRLYEDPQIENLLHIISCGPTDSFALDFELTGKEGFTAKDAVQPVIQVAFQYTIAVPAGSKASAGGAAENGDSQGAGHTQEAACVLQRRVRVTTLKVAASVDPLDVQSHASSEAVITVLLHKIMRAARVQGIPAARLLLRDWLAILSANYHAATHPDEAAQGPAHLAQLPINLAFHHAENLAPLPRLVYALLRSPLLTPPVEGQHPDLVTFLETMWGALPPGELVRAVYPVLSSYLDAETPMISRHSLSRGALLADGAPPIFVLDAWIIIMVLYTRSASPSLPFPPPQQSALRKAIAAARHERRITPMVKVVREGTEEAELFFHLLLDEPDAEAGETGGQQQQQGSSSGTGQQSGAAAYGLVQWLDHIRSEVVRQLRLEAQALATRQ